MTLEEGQKITIAGIEGTVTGRYGSWHLSCRPANDAMFLKKGLHPGTFVKEVAGHQNGGCFPETNTLDDLTKVVMALKNYRG